MAERVKLNRITLREQKQKLLLYERFLPALEARKQQFLMQLAIVRKEIGEQQSAVDKKLEEIARWSSLYWNMTTILPFFISLREIRRHVKNVAGLKVPVLEEVVFDDPPYSLFATPYSFDEVLARTREVISLREHIKILKEQEGILMAGFRKTSQRINLYEQRLIPECREVIRKVTVYLQDQQAAAVGVAKVAKRLNDEASY